MLRASSSPDALAARRGKEVGDRRATGPTGGAHGRVSAKAREERYNLLTDLWREKVRATAIAIVPTVGETSAPTSSAFPVDSGANARRREVRPGRSMASDDWEQAAAAVVRPTLL